MVNTEYTVERITLRLDTLLVPVRVFGVMKGTLQTTPIQIKQ